MRNQYNNRLVPNSFYEKMYSKKNLLEMKRLSKIEINEDNSSVFIPIDIKVSKNLEDNVNKIECLLKDSIFISLGFMSFIKNCMKGFNYIRIYRGNHTNKTTSLQEFILYMFCNGNYTKITNVYGYLDYDYPEDFPNIKNIKNEILKGDINPYKLAVIESMLHSYLNESNIYNLWHKMKNITIEEHNYFMRFFIALSALYRMDFGQMIEIGTRFFEYYNQEGMNKERKLPKNLYSDLFDYDPILEFFFDQNEVIEVYQPIQEIQQPQQPQLIILDENTIMKISELGKKVDEMRIYIKTFFNGKPEQENIMMDKLIQSEQNIKNKIISNPKDDFKIGTELYSILMN